MMADTAQFNAWGPFFKNGALVTAPRLFHYLAGTTSLKDAWLERAKLSTAAQPIVGDANGVVAGYFDGMYKIVVTLSDESTVLFTWDNVNLTEDEHRLEGSLLWDPSSNADAGGETSPPVTVAGASLGDFVLVAAPYDLQGVLATAYVSAANTVRIRIQNETGSTIDLSSGTWRVRVLQR